MVFPWDTISALGHLPVSHVLDYAAQGVKTLLVLLAGDPKLLIGTGLVLITNAYLIYLCMKCFGNLVFWALGGLGMTMSLVGLVLFVASVSSSTTSPSPPTAVGWGRPERPPAFVTPPTPPPVYIILGPRADEAATTVPKPLRLPSRPDEPDDDLDADLL
jgi:hypothetical protein